MLVLFCGLGALSFQEMVSAAKLITNPLSVSLHSMKSPRTSYAVVALLSAFSACAVVLGEWGTGSFPPAKNPYSDGSPAIIQRVAFGNGIFTAIGIAPRNGGDIYSAMFTSFDGARWLDRTNTFDNGGATEIAFEAGQFVALVRGDGYVPGWVTRVRLSTNGVDWNISYPTGSQSISGFDLNAVAYGNGRWVIVADPVTSLSRTNVFFSTDGGGSWTRSYLSVLYRRGLNIAFGNGIFVALADAGPGTSVVGFSSSNANPAWTLVTLSGTDITFGNGFFVVANGTSVEVAANFFAGTPRYTIPLPTANNVHLVKYLTNLFVAFAGRELLTSVDATNWLQHGTVMPFAPTDVSYGNGRFVTVSGTNFAYSPPLAQNFLQPAKLVGAITISGESGRQYALQAKDSLSTTTWQSVATIMLTNPPQTFIDPQATNSPQRFYRTQLLP
jgi:hypothetical protein